MSPVRVVVVGAGVVGLLTAVECVRGGAAVELVDRARIIPNERAASYDSHRVVRTLHRGDAQLTAAAAHLHQDWIDVEHEVGAKFFQHTGVLTAMSQFEAENALLVMKEAGSGAWLVSPRSWLTGIRTCKRPRVPAASSSRKPAWYVPTEHSMR